MTWTSIGPDWRIDPVDHRALGQLGPARPRRRAQDELGRVLGPGEPHERVGGVGRR